MEQLMFAGVVSEVNRTAKEVEVKRYNWSQKEALDTFKCMQAPEMMLMLAVFGIKLRTADIVEALGEHEKWMNTVTVFSNNADDYRAYICNGKKFWLTSGDTVVYINGKQVYKGKMTQMRKEYQKEAAL